jgi:hypothetical protein
LLHGFFGTSANFWDLSRKADAPFRLFTMVEIYGPKIRTIAMTALGLYRDLGDAVATLIKEAKKDQG